MTTHELKCWPRYFEPLIQGKKTAEIRKNDRDFKVGDVLHLREWDPQGKADEHYTGRFAFRTITHVLDLVEVTMLNEGHYVMLSFGETNAISWQDTEGQVR